MKRYLKLTLAIAAALALLVLIVFTLATTSANMSNPSRPLRVRLAGEPVTLDINLATDSISFMVLNQLVEGLYRYKPDGSTEPAGATGYEISGDGKVYTITLRADALWSDGVPVIAQHYVDGIIRLLDPATGAAYAWLMYFIEGADVKSVITWLPTPTPIPVPTLEPCPTEYAEYRGTTDQNRPISLCIKRDSSAVTRIMLNYSITCGGYTDYGAGTMWEWSSRDGWPIENRTFRIRHPYAFEVTGTFSQDFSVVTGTWQGIIVLCTGIPGPCWEHCRGPVGQWNATRWSRIYRIYLPIIAKNYSGGP